MRNHCINGDSLVVLHLLLIAVIMPSTVAVFGLAPHMLSDHHMRLRCKEKSMHLSESLSDVEKKILINIDQGHIALRELYNRLRNVVDQTVKTCTMALSAIENSIDQYTLEWKNKTEQFAHIVPIVARLTYDSHTKSLQSLLMRFKGIQKSLETVWQQ